MNPRGFLFIVRFCSDQGAPMALAACCPMDDFERVCSAACAHPMLAHLDEAGRRALALDSLERWLLERAGVAAKTRFQGVEDFFGELPQPAGFGGLELSGRLNARKALVVEDALRGWTDSMFPGCSPLPGPRPITQGTAQDLAALRAGWRAEAQARAPAKARLAGAFSPPGADGFPNGELARRG